MSESGQPPSGPAFPAGPHGPAQQPAPAQQGQHLAGPPQGGPPQGGPPLPSAPHQQPPTGPLQRPGGTPPSPHASESDQGHSSAFAPPGVAFAPVSTSLTSVRLISTAVWLGIPFLGALIPAIIFGGWVWIAPAVLLIFIVWAFLLIPRQVRAIGYAESDEDLLVRKGILFKSLSIVPYGRMQFVDVNAGPLDRAFGVAQVKLHTASAATDATIPGLPPEEAARLRDRLTERGEARLAGL